MTTENIQKNKLIKIDEKEYRELKHLSHSSIKLLLQSPNAFYKMYFKDEKKAPTEAMKLGSAIHSFLAGETLNFEVLPSDVKGNIYIEGGGKQEEAFKRFEVSPYFKIEDWDIVHTDKTFKFFHRHYKTMEDLAEAEKERNILSFASMGKYEEMTEGLKKQELYHAMKNEKVHKEMSIFFDYADIEIKARLDGVYVDKNSVIIYDYKTTSGNFEAREIYKTIKTYAYNLQAYTYIQAVKTIYPNRDIVFCIFLQSKENPDNCALVEISEKSPEGSVEKCLYEEGEAMFKKGIEVYKEFMENGTDKEWLNKACKILFNFNHNQIMYENNKAISQYYPQGGDELLYDIEEGILNCNK